MNKYNNFFIIIFILSFNILFAHEELVHQHIVKEAWSLLKSSNPSYYNNLEMNYWIGNNENDGPWSFYNQGRVVAGSYREDDEDVIWYYSCPTIPSILHQYTNTHFWMLPYGNPANSEYLHTLSGFSCGFEWECGPVPGNTWHRLQKYILGGWELRKQYYPPGTVTFELWDGSGSYKVSTRYGPIGLVYEGLVEGWRNLYHTGYMKLVGFTASDGSWQYIVPPVEIKLNGTQKYFCYEILGRMAHCIADMSVPAHTHLDPHPPECDQGDSYETKMAEQYGNYTALNCGGQFVDPFVQTQYDRIFYLAFTMHEVGIHFPSNDAYRWNPWTEPPFQMVSTLLQGAPTWDQDPSNYFSGYGPNGITQERFNIIANYSMYSAIRITAGLFYWFAKKIKECQVWDVSLQNIQIQSGDNQYYCGRTSVNAAGPDLNNNETYFIIEPNASVVFEAGNNIILKNGFYAKPLSNFTAIVVSYDMLSKSKNISSFSNSDNKNQASIPPEFSLFQNYPNPFNFSTLIKYGLKKDINVTLKIYNILGQEIKTLANELQSAGYKTIIWDGTNNNGVVVSSGVYLLRLEAGEFVAIKKMLVIK